MKNAARIFYETLASTAGVDGEPIPSATLSQVDSALWEKESGELLDMMIYFGNAIAHAAIGKPVWPYDVICVPDMEGTGRISATITQDSEGITLDATRWAIASFQWEDALKENKVIDVPQLVEQWRAMVSNNFGAGETIDPEIVVPFILAQKVADIIGDNILDNADKMSPPGIDPKHSMPPASQSQ